MLHRYFILVCLILIYICINQWSTVEHASFENNGIDCILNIGHKTVYIFNNELCLKYTIIGGIYNNDKGYPKKIEEEFPGIPSNIDTAFLLSKNKIAFLKQDKTYIYNYKNKKLDSGYPKNTSVVFNKFLINASCIIPFGNNTFAVFKNTQYIMYKPGQSIDKIYNIQDTLSPFFENMNAGTTWGEDANNYIYFFFKNDKYIKYQIKKKIKTDLFSGGHVKGSSKGKQINDVSWPGISMIFKKDAIVQPKCPPGGFTLQVNGTHCKNKAGNICTVGHTPDKRFPDCKFICDVPFVSTGGIKYNELILLKIYPNNYLGEKEFPLTWENKNVYVIEQDIGCMQNNNTDKLIMWNDYIKIKNVSSQKFLSLSKTNTDNIYKILKHPTHKVANDKYVSDSDKFRICIDIKNDSCAGFFQNGQNDIEGLVTIYRITTAKMVRNVSADYNKDGTRTLNKSFKDVDDLTKTIDDLDESSHQMKLEYDPKLEKYYESDGSDYRGMVNQTQPDGNICLDWSTKHQITKNTIKKSGIGHHNYCRNPNGAKDKPWCYSSKPNTIWEYCNVGQPSINYDSPQSKLNIFDVAKTSAQEESSEDNLCKKYEKDTKMENYCADNATDYRGTVNWTTDNIQCKKWPESFQQIYTDNGIGNHNYCRNPDNSNDPWCFVDDVDNPVGICKVGKPSRVCKPTKNNETEMYYTDDGSDYKGTESTTIKGNECISWNSDTLGNNRIEEYSHNHCRNPPGNMKAMPWCYTKNNKWEYCDIKQNKNKCGFNKSTNKILCAFSIRDANVYYLFRNLSINNNKVIIYNVLTLNTHQSKILGVVNDITWPGMPFKDNIDAAYYNKNNIIYFFNGANVVKYDIRLKNQVGNIISIGTEFPNLEFKSNINCIIEKNNDECYVIRGNNYVLFNFITKQQISSMANPLSSNIIAGLSISNIDASVTFKNNKARLFKDNYYVDMDVAISKQLSPIPLSIDSLYSSFWNININNPLFNKQQILVDNINLIETYKLVSEIKNKGGLEKYIKTTNEDIYDISRKFNIDLDKLLEAAEYGIFNEDVDNKASTYSDPPM